MICCCDAGYLACTGYSDALADGDNTWVLELHLDEKYNNENTFEWKLTYDKKTAERRTLQKRSKWRAWAEVEKWRRENLSKLAGEAMQITNLDRTKVRRQRAEVREVSNKGHGNQGACLEECG
jgi:hypothetical protein